VDEVEDAVDEPVQAQQDDQQLEELHPRDEGAKEQYAANDDGQDAPDEGHPPRAMADRQWGLIGD
jgi:hypothetical protein